MSHLAAARAAKAAKKANLASRAKEGGIARTRNMASLNVAAFATRIPEAAAMTPQVKERPKNSRVVGTPGIFTYLDWDEVIGVNIVLGRKHQEPAAEPEGLGNLGHGYWDEVHVGAQLQEWTASPCGGCGKKLALRPHRDQQRWHVRSATASTRCRGLGIL